MLRETLKQEIDNLSESQLQRIAAFINLVKIQAQPPQEIKPFWQRATPVERAEEFRSWVSQLPDTALSLPDEAFDRENIYE